MSADFHARKSNHELQRGVLPTQPYIYEPLASQHIRLLTLQSGRFIDPIEISINQARTAETEHPRYEALSYCWGNPQNSVDVMIKPDYKSLTIGPSLHSALLHLRHQKKPRVLWIDAICINQTDNQEKSVQVRKMGNIYRHAQRVVVWLGTASDSSDHAIEVLAHLGRQVEFDDQTSSIGRMPGCDPDCKQWYRREHPLPYREDEWSSIRALIGRPWFTRVWIWQEIHLAKQDTAVLQCSHAEISWINFKHAIMCIVTKQQNGLHEELSSPWMWEQLAYLYRFLRASDKYTSDLLEDMRNHCLCYDPRDRLYSILDLGSNGSQIQIEPNYDKPVAQVYYGYCVEHVLRCGKGLWSLDFLAGCEIDSSFDSLSWIPNWSEPLRSSRYELSPHSGSFRGSCELIDGLTLRVNTVHCAVIQDCSSPAPLNPSVETLSSILQQWIHRHSSESSTRGIANVLIDRKTSLQRGPKYPSLEDVQAALQACICSSTSSDSCIWRKSLLRILSDIGLVLGGRCIYRTTGGKLGLGPASCKPGDMICSILACPFLMVLRRNKEYKFLVVGYCSLEGFADMEALLGPLPAGTHVVDGSIDRRGYDMWFVNPDVGTKTRVDPRLGDTFPGWMSTERDEEDRIVWENIQTGEATWYDPRHSDIGFLKGRGVKIESLDLV